MKQTYCFFSTFAHRVLTAASARAKLLTAIALCLFSMTMYAQYSWVCTSGTFSTTGSKLGDITWKASIAGVSQGTGVSGEKCVQIAKNNGLTLSTNDFSGKKIINVTLQTWGSGGNTCTLTCGTYTSSQQIPTSYSSTGATISFDNVGICTGTLELIWASTGKAFNVRKISVTYESAPSYTVTAVANPTGGGSVSVDGNKITATPNTGWQISTTNPYTVTSGTATVEQSGNEFTVTPSSDCTVQINFEKEQTYTLTYQIGNDIATKELPGGTNILSELPASATSCDATSTTFIGWTTTPINGKQPTCPELITEDATITSDITVYAVFAKAEEGGLNITNTEIVLADGVYNGNSTPATITWTKEGVISILQEKDNSTINVGSSYVSAPRWYKDHVITFTPLKTITKVEVTATASGYKADGISTTATNASVSISLDNKIATITPINGSQVFTINTTAQVRPISIKVYYSNKTTTYTDYMTTCDDSKVWVTYDVNGGTTVCENTSVTKGENYTICSTKPIREGYTFLWWQNKDNENYIYAAGDEIANMQTSVVLVAQWCKNISSVTPEVTISNVLPTGFELTWKPIDGARDYELLITDKATNTDIISEKNLTATTYTATGLSPQTTYEILLQANSDCGENSDIYTQDLSLPAATAQVTFDANGGEGNMQPIEVAFNGTATLRENGFVRTGWRFMGWNTKQDGTGTKYEDKASVKIDGDKGITLYAQWAQLYTVVFRASGKDFETQEYEYLSGEALKFPTQGPEASSYACEEYTFVGWSTTEQPDEVTAKPTLVTSTTVTDDLTLYAVWSKAGDITDNYEQITLSTELSEGEYLIVGNNNDTYKVLTTEAGSTSGTFKTKSVTPADKVIANTDAMVVWNITINGNQYAICNKSSKQYLNINSSGTLVLENAPGYYSLSVSNDDFDFTANGKHLSYYSTNSVFNAYNSNNGFNVYLYKRVVSYGYTTQPYCCTDLAKVSIVPEATVLELDKDGKATTTVVCLQTGGGEGEWSYRVSPSETAVFDGTNFTAKAAGTYTLYATYTENCAKTASVTITVNATPTLYSTSTDLSPEGIITFGEQEKPKCGSNSLTANKKSFYLGGYNLKAGEKFEIQATDGYKFAISSSATLDDYLSSYFDFVPENGKISKSIYILAFPPAQSEEEYDGTITITYPGAEPISVQLKTTHIICPKYKATFINRGAEYEAVDGYAGDMINAPATNPEACHEPVDYVFDGWATEQNIDGVTSYTKVTFPYEMPKNDIKIYAVYKYKGEGDTSFKPGESGDYQISAKTISDTYYAKGTVSNKQLSSTASETEASSYKITAIPPTKDGGEYLYTIQYGTDYIGWKSSTDLQTTNSLPTDAKNYYWKISEGTHGSWRVTSFASSSTQTIRGLVCRSSDDTRFRAYAESNVNGTEYYDLEIGKAAPTLYTTSPSCGPHISLRGDVRITSAKGVRVDAYTPLELSAINMDKNADNAAVTIRATSDNLAFTIKEWGTTGNGSTTLTLSPTGGLTDATLAKQLCVVYTPTEAGKTETATITVTATRYNGTTAYAEATIEVTGRSLPAEFVIAAKKTDGTWVALPNTLATSSTGSMVAAEPIEVNEEANPTKVPKAPSNVVYSATGRYYVNEQQTGLRFTNGTGYLQGSTASETKVWLSPTNSQKAQQWTLRTEDFADYLVRLEASEEGRYLSYNETYNYIANYKQEKALRLLPIEAVCTRFAAPDITGVTSKSETATLTWTPIEGATGYEYSLDNTEWTSVGNVTTCEITGLSASTDYTVYLRVAVDNGENCSYAASTMFTTTNCDDVPQNVTFESDANSITLTWKMISATATIELYSDAECTTPVTTVNDAKSPVTISNLDKATTYYVIIKAGGSCPSAITEVSTEHPQLDVVEWAKDRITVSLNMDENVKFYIEEEVAYGSGEDKVADELFFSKYFETNGNNKMLGLYNGTNNTLSLENYTIMQVQGTKSVQANLTKFGKQQGYIQPGEEIILVRYDDRGVARTEAEKHPESKDWFEIANKDDESQLMQFAGKRSIGLYKDNVLIDVIGSHNESGELTFIPSSCSAEVCQIYVDNVSQNDDNCYFTYNGDNVTTDVIETDYALSTNRCLLIRKNTVVSGTNAVDKNVLNSTDCADMSASFATLADEWTGLRIGSGKSTDEDVVQATAVGLSYLGTFNYSDYYVTYEPINKGFIAEDNPESKYIPCTKNADGTITLDFRNYPLTKDNFCRQLRITMSDGNDKVLLRTEQQVPIIVDADVTTAEAAYFDLGEKVDCKTCEVVIRDGKKLKAVAGGKEQFKNMYVYPASKLELTGGIKMTLDNLYMFAKNDEVSYAIINNNDAAISINNVSHVKRIDGKNWYPFSLPYDCRIADIVALYGEELGEYGQQFTWGIKYYDGEARQEAGTSANIGGQSKFWYMMPKDGILKANKGYVVALFGKDENKEKLIHFVPDTESPYTEGGSESQKLTMVQNWSVNLEAAPRHHGWNFTGSPYISLFGQIEGEGLYNTSLKMGYTQSDGTQAGIENVYVSIPDEGCLVYRQVLASATQLKPFTAYFVQTVDPEEGSEGGDITLTYSKAQSLLLEQTQNSALTPRRAGEQNSIIFAELNLTATTDPLLADNAGLQVSDRFTDKYEIGFDLTKMYAEAGKPQFYTQAANQEKLAYQALPDAQAQNIPLGIYVPKAGEYTVSLNRRVSRLENAEAVYLLHSGIIVADLLLSDYTILATAKGEQTGYMLDIRRATKVVTGTEQIATDEPYAIMRDGQLTIGNLPTASDVAIYDALGRLVWSEQQATTPVVADLPQTGVYMVLITSGEQQYVLKSLNR